MLDLISAYENYLVNVKQASGNTTVSYLRDIRQFAGWLRDTEEAELVDATEYYRILPPPPPAQGRSCATISRSLASLKNFFRVFGVLRLSAGNAGAACTCRTWREKASPDSNRAGGRAALVSARLRGRQRVSGPCHAGGDVCHWPAGQRAHWPQCGRCEPGWLFSSNAAGRRPAWFPCTPER